MQYYIFAEESSYSSDYSSDYGNVYDANIIFYDEETSSWDNEDSDGSDIPPTQTVFEDIMLECPAPDEEVEC